MWTRGELKARAKNILKVSYWKAFLVSLVIAIAGGSSSTKFGSTYKGEKSGEYSANFHGFTPDILPYLPLIIGAALVVVLAFIAFRVLLGYPLEVGGRRYFIRSTQNDFDMNCLGFAFEKGKYSGIVISMLWRGFINFLWFLLLIIPGIIKVYAYRMVPYILADNPEIGYRRALELSNQMTSGHKFNIFVLDLSFLGWYILGTIAFVIGVIFVFPYQNATEAELYLILRQNAIDNGAVEAAELML